MREPRFCFCCCGWRVLCPCSTTATELAYTENVTSIEFARVWIHIMQAFLHAYMLVSEMKIIRLYPTVDKKYLTNRVRFYTGLRVYSSIRACFARMRFSFITRDYLLPRLRNGVAKLRLFYFVSWSYSFTTIDCILSIHHSVIKKNKYLLN